MSKKSSRSLRWVVEYSAIIVGAFICGAAIALLMDPNNIVPGGITGLAMICKDLLGVPMGVVLVVLNLPLIVLGWKHLGGKKMFLRTLVGVMVMALSIDLTTLATDVLTQDRLLVIFYGGLLSGVGLALVFWGRGTTGGTDIVGRLMNMWLDVSVGQAILGINVVVFGLAAFIYGLEEAAVALMLSFAATRTLDSVMHGMVATRSAMVVTRHPEAVKDAVRRHLGRTVTMMPAEGGFSKQPSTMLYVVVARSETARLKRRINEADPEAFVSIYTPREVMGAGLGS
nr:YitT family protein [Candidatus Krumholzibacteria bacterium]